jgi:hypothetical protein
MDLKQFLSSKLVNVWISEPNINVYVRKSTRLINNELRLCLDIGSVEVDLQKRNTGIFSSFLQKFEATAKGLNRTVYVECVLHSRFENFLLKKGYSYLRRSVDNIAPDMYKEVA